MVEKSEELNEQAVRFAKSGAFEEAVSCFTRAITIDKENYLLWFNLGITLRDFGKLSEAKEALEGARKLNDEDDDILEALAVVCFDLGLVEESLKLCSEGLEEDSQNPKLWNTAGVCYFSKNEFKDAAEAFETAVMLNSYYYDALYNLRDTYEELGNRAGVQECESRMKEIEGKKK